MYCIYSQTINYTGYKLQGINDDYKLQGINYTGYKLQGKNYTGEYKL